LSLLTSENKSSSSLGYQIASIVYIAIDLYDSEIAKKILNDQFKYIDILDFLESKKIKPDEFFLASNLLHLFSNNQNELLNNREIYENKFDKITDGSFDSKGGLFGYESYQYNDVHFGVIQKIGKKISQSKKLFDQS